MAAALVVVALSAAPARAGETLLQQKIVVDSYTGLAIGGYDPVAYFVDGGPRLGAENHELVWDGVTWRFVNEGNLAAFKQNPDVYAPQFGGHCAFALSRGYPAEGSPFQFLVRDQRLFLFASGVNRAAFLVDPDRFAADADRRWPSVAAALP